MEERMYEWINYLLFYFNIGEISQFAVVIDALLF